MAPTRVSFVRMRSNSSMIPLRTLSRQDSNMSTGSGGLTTAHESGCSLRDDQPLLDDDELEVVRTESPPSLEASQQVVKDRKRWYHSLVWLACTVLLAGFLVLENVFVLTSCGYKDGFKTDLAYLKPSIKLHRTRFAGAIRATPDGNRMHVPEPALDDKGRAFSGPPSPEIDEAWHDLIYGRYVEFTPVEVKTLNSDHGVPALVKLPLASNGDTERGLISHEGYYGGPDMLHSLHCINGLRKHLDIDYYNVSMPQAPKEYMRMHVDHCLEQLRQAVLCHGDMTPVTLKPVKNEEGKVWALLGETEREHTCRNGNELARRWIERAGEGERVESE